MINGMTSCKLLDNAVSNLSLSPSSPMNARPLGGSLLAFQTHLLPVVQSSSEEFVGDLLSLLPLEPVMYGVQEVLGQRPTREVLQVGTSGNGIVKNNSTMDSYSLF